MIDDVFVEQFVKREKTALNAAFKVLSIFATVVIIVFINVIPMLLGINIIFFTGLISIGIGVLCWFVNRRQNIEYEISITNDLFSVSRIIAESKRELLADFNVRECERIAPTTAGTFEEDLKRAEFVLNSTRYRQYEVSDSNWYCFVNSEGIKYVVIFEFKPKMYKSFRRYNPRNTFFMNITNEEKN
ncbi:MAG: DUF6106 family protein [Clostridia bacterium]|nr:DUF6106 family protein [Clostridia bacterium]